MTLKLKYFKNPIYTMPQAEEKVQEEIDKIVSSLETLGSGSFPTNNIASAIQMAIDYYNLREKNNEKKTEHQEFSRTYNSGEIEMFAVQNGEKIGDVTRVTWSTTKGERSLSGNLSLTNIKDVVSFYKPFDIILKANDEYARKKTLSISRAKIDTGSGFIYETGKHTELNDAVFTADQIFPWKTDEELMKDMQKLMVKMDGTEYVIPLYNENHSSLRSEAMTERFNKVLSCKKPLRIIQSARRQGKTSCIVEEIVNKALTEIQKKIIVTATQKIHVEEIFDRVREIIIRSPIKLTRDTRSSGMLLCLENGTEIRAIPAYNDCLWCGQVADYLYVDEAQYLKEEMWSHIFPCVLDGKMLLTISPDGRSYNSLPESLRKFYSMLPTNMEGFFHWPMLGEEKERFERASKDWLTKEAFQGDCYGDWP